MSKSAVDTPTLPNSVLNRQQANRFIDLVIDYSVLLKKARTSRVNHAKGSINKLDLGTIVTEGAATTSTLSTNTPTEGVLTYDTVKYRAGFDLGTDFTEDNIEGKGIRDFLLNQFSKRMAIDSELGCIQGDETLTTGDGQTAQNNLLGVNDGWSKILGANVPAAQKLDAGGKSPTKKLYYDMKRKIPARFRVAKPDYVWIVPSGPSDKWKLEVSDRATPLGDTTLLSGMVTGPWGIPMLEVPLMPEDLTFGTSGTDGSEIWLTPLQNLLYFIQREITIEFDRIPRQDKWQVTMHYRSDCEVEDPNMVVLATNVSLSGTDYA